MKKLFDRVRKELTNYSFETKGWSFVLVLMLILIVLSSCSTLKYDPDYDPDMEEFQDHYDYCQPFWDMGATEIYMECMMNEEIRSRHTKTTTTAVPTNDLYTVTHGNTSTST